LYPATAPHPALRATLSRFTGEGLHVVDLVTDAGVAADTDRLEDQVSVVAVKVLLLQPPEPVARAGYFTVRRSIICRRAAYCPLGEFEIPLPIPERKCQNRNENVLFLSSSPRSLSYTSVQQSKGRTMADLA
jgi:hypothetical protein